jgi:RND family efflux transporter MFP subunit
MRTFALCAAFLAVATPLSADVFTLKPTPVTEWKAVYGRVEARDMVPARARIGGLVVELAVSEGDVVSAGQKLATVRDDKLAFQVAALDAQIRALESQLAAAQTELVRVVNLAAPGVANARRLDQLRPTVGATRTLLAAAEAQRSVVVQQEAEGDVLAPGDGRVLTVPVTRGAVVMAGEPIAVIGGGGFFLRLAIPERHAAALEEGAELRITAEGAESAGRLAKVYPQIENGRVIADVEVDGLDTAFVDARVLVEVPVGERLALLVPVEAVATRSGLDFVTVRDGAVEAARAVVLGNEVDREGAVLVEVLSGLAPGGEVVAP